MENPDDVSGFRLGRLLLSPTLATGTRYDSNIFQSDANPTSDVITTLTPRLTLQGDWRVEDEFIGAIRGTETIRLTDFTTGVKYMEFTEAVARSAESGQPVDLPLAD